MKEEKKPLLIRLLRYLPIAAVAIFALCFWDEFSTITPEQIAEYAQGEPLSSALLLIALYVFKSLSVIFPLVALQLASGLLFPVWQALLINFIGLWIALTIGYLMGRLTGGGFVLRFAEKYERIAALHQLDPKETLRTAFMLRVISVLPVDGVSIVFGSIKVPYFPYLLGSLCGAVPAMSAITFLGASVTDPGSPEFIIALGLTITLALASFFLDRRSRKKKRRA